MLQLTQFDQFEAKLLLKKSIKFRCNQVMTLISLNLKSYSISKVQSTNVNRVCSAQRFNSYFSISCPGFNSSYLLCIDNMILWRIKFQAMEQDPLFAHNPVTDSLETIRKETFLRVNRIEELKFPYQVGAWISGIGQCDRSSGFMAVGSKIHRRVASSNPDGAWKQLHSESGQPKKRCFSSLSVCRSLPLPNHLKSVLFANNLLDWHPRLLIER